MLALLLGMFTLAAPALLAQATLTVQGVLTKSDGTAIDDGEISITFRLWNAQNGGDTVHIETQSNVETIGGVYSVVLGLQPANPIMAAFDVPYFLGVSIGGGTELTPRPRLTHAPYALSLQGQNNKFPSVGTVLVDAINVAGTATTNSLAVTGAATINSLAVTGAATINSLAVTGVATAGAFVAPSGAPAMTTAGKGYSFGPGGDTDGGLFSKADGTVSIYTDSLERVIVENSGITAVGKVAAFAYPFGLGYGQFGGHSFFSAPTTGLFADLGPVVSPSGNSLDATELGLFLRGDKKISFTGSISSSIIGFHEDATFYEPVKFNDPISSDNDIITLDKPLYVDVADGYNYDNVTIQNDRYWKYANNANFYIDDTGTNDFTDIGIKVKSDVLATTFWAYSDKRIKKDFSRVNQAETLAKLKLLQVTDYHYIDEIVKGKKLEKGFIAQEVAEIEPKAITKSTDFVPSVYAPAAKILNENQQFIFSLPKPHGLQKGDKVRLFEGAVRHDVIVESATETEFSVAPWAAAAPAQVFVYGKEVSDFMAVDYDHIFTMNVAATQELARRVELLKQENAALRAQNAALEGKQARFEKQLSDLGKRLDLLELPATNGTRE